MSSVSFIRTLEQTLGISLPDNARAYLVGDTIFVLGKDAQGTTYEVRIPENGKVYRSRYCGKNTKLFDISTKGFSRKEIPLRWRRKWDAGELRIIPFCTDEYDKRYTDDKTVPEGRLALARLLISFQILINVKPSKTRTPLVWS